LISFSYVFKQIAETQQRSGQGSDSNERSILKEKLGNKKGENGRENRAKNKFVIFIHNLV